jgi:hypothetical protein
MEFVLGSSSSDSDNEPEDVVFLDFNRKVDEEEEKEDSDSSSSSSDEDEKEDEIVPALKKSKNRVWEIVELEVGWQKTYKWHAPGIFMLVY